MFGFSTANSYRVSVESFSIPFDEKNYNISSLAFESASSGLVKRKLSDNELLQLPDSALKQAIKNEDVRKGIYEGGFKLWECALDLIQFLKNVDLKGKKVLDLGCGHGLPGIYCLLQGAKHVSFQDLNKEVIEMVTIPNVISNLEKVKGTVDGTVSFYSGDWADSTLLDLVGRNSYDIILTAETLYSCESLPHLFNFMVNSLSLSGSFALVAAKRFYFGVGGSTSEFQTYCESKSRKVELVQVFENGVSNIREIWRLE